MTNTPIPFHVLIPAAGCGARMVGFDVPKQYIPLQGKPILRHTIERFLTIDGCQSVTVIINKDHQALYDKATKGLNIAKPAYGKGLRKNSVYSGLQSLVNVENDTLIVIHDAARPFINAKDIQSTLTQASRSGAACLATPVSDTLHNTQNDKTIDRTALMALQTPQIFRYNLIMQAHERLQGNDTFTDDRGMVIEMGHTVSLVEGSRSNIKITTPEDLTMAHQIMSNTMETITATGFDVHAFEDGSSVRLGGIDIAHNKSLKGHSDADVVLHAITDAILGTINEGDIGTHFPPSDPEWKDVDSAVFLTAALQKLNNKGGIAKFIDVTILVEEPKIGPHRAAMQARIAQITGLNAARISIKATTTEKLGFTGRGEGIACQCAVTIQIPSLD